VIKVVQSSRKAVIRNNHNGDWRPISHNGGAPNIVVIIPAFNEQKSIGRVLADLPRDWLTEVIVVDNGSTDGTAEVARAAEATVLQEPRRGYGSACLRGLEYAAQLRPDVVVFLDGDYSDHPEELPSVVAPILQGEADLVIGSRVLGKSEPGALLPQARFGNWLATRLVALLFGVRYTDLGPFRAVRYQALEKMEMRDRNFGWTVEMQIKAARLGLRVAEVPVRYRRRIGTSKVTGTLRGTLGAGYKILYTIFRYAFTPLSQPAEFRKEKARAA
jgi:glycosyltransferase involved in cell wall biosynthesis